MSTTRTVLSHVLPYCDIPTLTFICDADRSSRPYCLTRIYSVLDISTPRCTKKWHRRLHDIPGRAGLVVELFISSGSFEQHGDLRINAFGRARCGRPCHALAHRLVKVIQATYNLLFLHIGAAELIISSHNGMAHAILHSSTLGGLVLKDAGMQSVLLAAQLRHLSTLIVEFQYAAGGSSITSAGIALGRQQSASTLQWLAFNGQVTFPGRALGINDVYRCLTTLDLLVATVDAKATLYLCPHLQSLRLGANTTIANRVSWNPQGPALRVLQCSVSALLDLWRIRAVHLHLVDFERVSEYNSVQVAQGIADSATTYLTVTGWQGHAARAVLSSHVTKLTSLTIDWKYDVVDLLDCVVRWSF